LRGLGESPLTRRFECTSWGQCQLLHQVGETESEVVDVLPGLEREAIPFLTQLLHRRLPGAVEADTRGSDGIPDVLGGRLVRQGGHHLRRNRGKESVQCQPVLMELDSILELSCLQLHLHRQAPVVVVHLGEHQPWRAPTRLLDDALDDER
jgi:hypothetical protein